MRRETFEECKNFLKQKQRVFDPERKLLGLEKALRDAYKHSIQFIQIGEKINPFLREVVFYNNNNEIELATYDKEDIVFKFVLLVSPLLYRIKELHEYKHSFKFKHLLSPKKFLFPENLVKESKKELERIAGQNQLYRKVMTHIAFENEALQLNCILKNSDMHTHFVCSDENLKRSLDLLQKDYSCSYIPPAGLCEEWRYTKAETDVYRFFPTEMDCFSVKVNNQEEAILYLPISKQGYDDIRECGSNYSTKSRENLIDKLMMSVKDDDVFGVFYSMKEDKLHISPITKK